MEQKPIELALFAKNVRRFREMRGLSQAGLGSMIGVTHATISQYESGLITPKIDKLEALAAALRVPISQLFAENSDTTLTYDEIMLLANYRKLNDEGKADLRKHAQVMAASGIYAQ